MTSPRTAGGFTLVEVLAAIFLTAVVISVAVAFFVNLSRSTEAATLKIRDGRRALAVLDRVARDLQAAYLLVKPADADPLAHPWLFLAESNASGESADRLKFVTRNHRPRDPTGHGSDLAMVSYLLEPREEGRGYELLRTVAPGLPESLDRSFASPDDDVWMVVAEGIESFGVRLLDDGLEWQPEWDSSQLTDSSALPRAAEIEIAYLPGYSDEDAVVAPTAFDDEESEATRYKRRVRLPMRPVDLDAMLQEAVEALNLQEGEEEEDEEGEEGDDAPPENLADCDPDVIDSLLAEFELDMTLPLEDPDVQAALSALGLSCE